ncbi:MAG: hypothetical protein NTX44_04865 [Ignavibacteriales bacterium]|nr:hypothetical protein [Ignavibacteriales bacterium]
MKTKCALTITVLLSIAVTRVFAEDPVLPAKADQALIEENLLVGLNSTNEGLRYSCALMLGDLKSSQAVIPLMALLRQSDNFKLKTAAAWALCNIGDARGTFAVKREAEFNSCCKTKLVCAWYYENKVKQGSFVFRDVDQAVLAEVKEPR